MLGKHRSPKPKSSDRHRGRLPNIGIIMNETNLILSLSHKLVDALYDQEIDSYSDDVKAYMCVLRQMFYENQSGICLHRVEELTEEESNVIRFRKH